MELEGKLVDVQNELSDSRSKFEEISIKLQDEEVRVRF